MLRLDGGRLIAQQVFVVTPGLKGFVAKILDGFEVQKRIDRLLVGTRVHVVHGAPVVRAPFGDHDRENDIHDQRGERDGREPDVVKPGEVPKHQAELKQRRQDAIEGVGHQRLDGARSALDIAADPACLARKMKSQRQRVQVLEHLERNLSHGVLGDPGEQRLPELCEQGRRKPQQPVADDQPDRHDEQCAWLRAARIERVDQVLEKDGDAKIGELGGDKAKNSQCHPAAILKQVGQQIADDFPVGAVLLARGIGSGGDVFGRAATGMSHTRAMLCARRELCK